MIINVCDKEEFFRSINKDSVFICGFNLQYKYTDLFLERFVGYFPEIKDALESKSFKDNTYQVFTSEKYGKLFVLCAEIPEPSQEKEVNKEMVHFRDLTDKINPNIENDSTIYHIDMNYFSEIYIKKIFLKLLKVFALSSKKIIIYN